MAPSAGDGPEAAGAEAAAPADAAAPEGEAAVQDGGDVYAGAAHTDMADEEGEGDAGAASEAIRLHYIDEGDGEPLILVHSACQSIYTWRSVMEPLKRDYRLIALDLPGHGFSDRPTGFGCTVGDMAELLRLFMDAIGVKSAHFVGFSLSYAYILELALRYPERVGRMVFVAPGGMTPGMPLPIKLVDSTVFGPVAAAIYNMRTVRSVLESYFFDLTFITDETVTEYYRTISDGRSRRAVRRTIHGFDDDGLLPRLRELFQPVLMLVGSDDKVHDPKAIAQLHQAIATARAVEVRNCGHMVHEEKPDKLIKAILEFIPVERSEVNG